MKTLFKCLLVGVIFFVMNSCGKEDLEQVTQAEREINIPNVSTFSDQTKLQVGKWLAHACNENEAFKKMLFQSIVDIETGESNELFVLDFINRRYENGFVKEAIMNANNLSEEEFENFFGEVEARLYNLVIDVPDFITWYFHPKNHFTGVKENFQTFPFVFYPDVKVKNNHGKWTGFGEYEESAKNYSSKEGLVLYEIGEREVYKEVVPIFIKQAELSYVLSVNNRNIEKDALIDANFGDIIEEGKDCIKEKIDEIATPITLGSSLYSRINLLELKHETSDCNHQLPPRHHPPGWGPRGPEICDNGIYDDGDGEIDEEDCIPQYETDCANGIDDDQDGLIDQADPDCDCNCLRDCREDHNYLVRHSFDNVLGYYAVTSENLPGIEKTITLRYDITRLDAPNCPPGGGDCPFTTNHKIVFDRATMLVCGDNIDDMDPNDIQTLCIQDETAWSALPTGFFYGFVSTSSNPCAGNNDCIFFSILNGFVAQIIGANYWVVQKTFYLPAAGDGNSVDWDGSIYGDQIRVNISETDVDQIVGTSTETQEFSFSVTVSSSVGIKIAIPGVEGVSAEGENKYEFTTEHKTTQSNTIKIVARNLANLGDFDLTYCADNNVNYQFSNNFNEITPQGYNMIDEQNVFLNWWNVIVKE